MAEMNGEVCHEIGKKECSYLKQKGTYNYYDDWDNVSAIVQFPDMHFFIPFYPQQRCKSIFTESMWQWNTLVFYGFLLVMNYGKIKTNYWVRVCFYISIGMHTWTIQAEYRMEEK